MNFNQHIRNTETKAKGALKLVKAISGTTWGQQKETITNTYKQYIRPIIEYACPTWSPVVSTTNMEKLQKVQNAALRCATGHTKDTGIHHLHSETQVLPLYDHMRLITSQFRESARDPDHPLHSEASAPDPERPMKGTALHTACVTVVHSCDPEGEEEKQRERNKRTLHTAIVQNHLQQAPEIPLIQTKAPEISSTERSLPRETRRTLAQLRAGKCPLLKGYLHRIGAEEDPSCPLCGHPEHNTAHIFECPTLPTELTPVHLWRTPADVADLLERWKTALGAAEEAVGAAVRQ